MSWNCSLESNSSRYIFWLVSQLVQLSGQLTSSERPFLIPTSKFFVLFYFYSQNLSLFEILLNFTCSSSSSLFFFFFAFWCVGLVFWNILSLNEANLSSSLLSRYGISLLVWTWNSLCKRQSIPRLTVPHPSHFPWEDNLRACRYLRHWCQFDEFPSVPYEASQRYLDESRGKWKFSKHVAAWLKTTGGREKN